MKKLLSLLLAAMLLLPPALAEEKTDFQIETPLLAADYEAAVLNFLSKSVNDGVTMEWITPAEDETIRLLILGGSACGIGFVAEDGQVDEIVFVYEGALDEETFKTIFTMFVFTTAPVATLAGLDNEAALEVVGSELYTMFMDGTILNAQAEWHGKPVIVLAGQAEDGENYVFQYLLDLIPEPEDAQ